MADLESILQFLEDTFQVSTFPDHPNALNGLQVEGPHEVARMAAAVDASEATIREVERGEYDLLLVHHGLYWDGFGPLTGPRFRKVRSLIRGGTGLYALHLPLDAHEEMGNCAILSRALGFQTEGPFGEFKGVSIGWWGHASTPREQLRRRFSEVVGGEVRLVAGGPEHVSTVGVVTGGGASALKEAAEKGLDALVTGEAAHHHFHEAMERGVNLFLGGHYATETFGVQALAAKLAEKFQLEWEFLHLPTGF